MEIIEYQTYREEEILPLYASVGWTAYTDAPMCCTAALRGHC
mgnify:CR=1 FL=1